MTTAPARWWAPFRPGTDLDDVDRAMLTPSGGDARLDLGGSFLAAHRVGAAACEHAAQNPLLGERGLVGALAEARGHLGPVLAEAVSKSVGGEAEGHLLTRDFLDDADAAALGLYRACVAKGVPASQAAQRVGAVYGVDSRSLGRFRVAALDPRTSPIAIANLADEILFSHIEKLAAEETQDAIVEVQKATATMERPTLAQQTMLRPSGAGGSFSGPTGDGEYARDSRGRFATVDTLQRQPGALARFRNRLGAGLTQFPAVQDGRPTAQIDVEAEQAKEAERAKELARVRQVRQARDVRGTRAAAAAAAKPKQAQQTEQATETRQETERANERQVATRLTERQLTTRLAELDAVLLSIDPKAAEPWTTPPMTPEEAQSHGSMTDRFEKPPFPFDLNMLVTRVNMPGVKGAEFYTKIAAQPGHIFQVGELVQNEDADLPLLTAPKGTVAGDDIAHNQIDVDQSRAATAEIEATKYDKVIPADFEDVHISMAQIERERGGMTIRDYIAAKYEQEMGVDPELPADQRYELRAKWSKYADSQGDGFHFLYRGDAGEDEMPMVHEYLIEPGNTHAINSDASATRHPEWEFDESTLLKPAGDDPPLPKWDAHGKFLVKRTRLIAASQDELDSAKKREGFGKAVTLADRRAQVADQERDPSNGRWVDAGALERFRTRAAAAQVQTTNPERAAAIRRKRQARAGRAQARVTAVPAQQVAAAQPRAQERQAAARAPERQSAERVLEQQVGEKVVEQANAWRPPQHAHKRAKVPFEFGQHGAASYHVFTQDEFRSRVQPGSRVVEDRIGLDPGMASWLDMEGDSGPDARWALLKRQDFERSNQTMWTGTDDYESAVVNLVGDEVKERRVLTDLATKKLHELNVTGVSMTKLASNEGAGGNEAWRVRWDTSGNEPMYVVQMDEIGEEGSDLELVRQAGNQTHFTSKVHRDGTTAQYAIPLIVYRARWIPKGGPRERLMPDDDD